MAPIAQWKGYGVLAVVLLAASASAQTIDTDLASIQRSWGQVSTYADNPENYFGVQNVGLPDGCQVEQAHSFQRHAQRFPTGSAGDGGNDERFAAKIASFTKAHPGSNDEFTGPLSFLPGYSYIMSENYLTNIGAGIEFERGASFWNRYGRILYNASVGQVAYNNTAADGSTLKKPVLRTTSESRIHASANLWASAFFGAGFEEDPNLQPRNVSQFYSLVIIPEGGDENNTLVSCPFYSRGQADLLYASYDSCTNNDVESIGDIGDAAAAAYAKVYLKAATARLQKYVPAGLKLNTSDALAMQAIAAYENQYIGESSFTDLFTAEEWAGFEYVADLIYYYDYSFGNPTGRAQGIGYVQELLARLENEYINVGNTSVNTTYDDNGKTFPLGQPFYLDVSHDDIIVAILTALSLDYFHQSLNLTQYPPDPTRHFKLSSITPFGANLITEVIGCGSPSPTAVKNRRVYYTPTQYGYKPHDAPNKFIRVRLNNGILPLSTIRGGLCDGRSDGLCPLEKFVESQKTATARANYQYACFANYTGIKVGTDYDGTINATSANGS